MRSLHSVWSILRARWVLIALCSVLWSAPGHAAFEQPLDDIQSDRLEAANQAYQIGDYPAALDLFTDLANEGVAEAQFYLGFMNAQSLGVPQNYQAAAQWYEEAALQGHPQAQNYLGLLYFEGNGVARAFREAFLYFELAAAAGNKDAANNRLIVARKMTSAQITEAQKAAGEIIRALRSNVKKVILPRRTATGVAVAGGNLFLTHASAVGDCRELTVRFEDGTPRDATMAVIDPFNGLALLAAAGLFAEPVQLRDTPISVGDAVIIVGFGLDDKKRPVIVTTDADVTADPALLRVDQRYVQLSSLVGATQLGAAVVDRDGRLVGIMEPTVEARQLAQVRGKPQRTGFALRHELVRLLLDINGHHHEAAAKDDAEMPQTLEDRLATVRAATVAIECWREQDSDETPESDEAAEQRPTSQPG
jgi:S1-C subfamily serine protease